MTTTKIDRDTSEKAIMMNTYTKTYTLITGENTCVAYARACVRACDCLWRRRRSAGLFFCLCHCFWFCCLCCASVILCLLLFIALPSYPPVFAFGSTTNTHAHTYKRSQNRRRKKLHGNAWARAKWYGEQKETDNKTQQWSEPAIEQPTEWSKSHSTNNTHTYTHARQRQFHRSEQMNIM